MSELGSAHALDARAMGDGPPLILVHGALADRRLWDRHLPLLAGAGLHAIAVTLPHHGPVTSAGDPRPFGLRAHTDALTRFIEGLGVGPVHLVAWSYAAHAALTLAVERPALLRSVFAYEPGMPTFLETTADRDAFAADVEALFAPVEAALAQRDLESALVRLIDGSAGCTGYFAAQSAITQRIELDNAHTLPRLMQQTLPPALTAADLATVTLPTCVAAGERTRPVYGIVSRAAQRALPAHALTVAGAGHFWPDEEPDAFCEAVRVFIAGL